jgi:hypothetical protein
MLSVTRGTGHQYKGPSVDIGVVIDVTHSLTTAKILFERRIERIY